MTFTTYSAKDNRQVTINIGFTGAYESFQLKGASLSSLNCLEVDNLPLISASMLMVDLYGEEADRIAALEDISENEIDVTVTVSDYDAANDSFGAPVTIFIGVIDNTQFDTPADGYRGKLSLTVSDAISKLKAVMYSSSGSSFKTDDFVESALESVGYANVSYPWSFYLNSQVFYDDDNQPVSVYEALKAILLFFGTPLKLWGTSATFNSFCLKTDYQNVNKLYRVDVGNPMSLDYRVSRLNRVKSIVVSNYNRAPDSVEYSITGLITKNPVQLSTMGDMYVKCERNGWAPDKDLYVYQGSRYMLNESEEGSWSFTPSYRDTGGVDVYSPGSITLGPNSTLPGGIYIIRTRGFKYNKNETSVNNSVGYEQYLLIKNLFYDSERDSLTQNGGIILGRIKGKNINIGKDMYMVVRYSGYFYPFWSSQADWITDSGVKYTASGHGGFYWNAQPTVLLQKWGASPTSNAVFGMRVKLTKPDGSALWLNDGSYSFLPISANRGGYSKFQAVGTNPLIEFPGIDSAKVIVSDSPQPPPSPQPIELGEQFVNETSVFLHTSGSPFVKDFEGYAVNVPEGFYSEIEVQITIPKLTSANNLRRAYTVMLTSFDIRMMYNSDQDPGVISEDTAYVYEGEGEGKETITLDLMLSSNNTVSTALTRVFTDEGMTVQLDKIVYASTWGMELKPEASLLKGIYSRLDGASIVNACAAIDDTFTPANFYASFSNLYGIITSWNYDLLADKVTLTGLVNSLSKQNDSL